MSSISISDPAAIRRNLKEPVAANAAGSIHLRKEAP
jgi:hypothetical protein